VIYFAHALGTALVKIGFTAGDPRKRLKELQTGCPHKLSLLAVIAGDQNTEAAWHAEFAADRQQGEWFFLSPRLAVRTASAYLSWHEADDTLCTAEMAYAYESPQADPHLKALVSVCDAQFGYAQRLLGVLLGAIHTSGGLSTNTAPSVPDKE